ncbi:MAG: metal-dependent hydrolase [Promethearchaeota archaeon]
MDAFTHLFLQSTVMWALLGLVGVQGWFTEKSVRQLAFWPVMFAGIAPDFDIFIPNGHRLFPTHSLVFPAIFALIGLVLWATKQSQITYVVSWSMGLQWLFHLFLDLDGYAMGLLWPFSPLVFSISLVRYSAADGFRFLQVLVMTPQEWIDWGRAALTNPVWVFEPGVPVLSLALFLLTVGRAFWPWWPCGRKQESSIGES